jgi:predicted GNAT family acetyltransferase
MRDDSSGDAIGQPPSGDLRVVDNRTAQRYEIAVDGEVAFLEYQRRRHSIALIHTEVPASLGGRGLGPLLAKTALEAARADGLRVLIICPFLKAYLEKHPEYQALATSAGDRPPGKAG